MDITNSSYLLFYSANFAYILSAVICAAVRWGHMCRPYNRAGSYYYPGRKQVTFFYLSVLLQLPYLLDIGSAAAWQYVRTFGILFYPLCSSMMLLKYFRGESRHKQLRRLAISVPPGVLLAVLFLNSIGGGILTEAELHGVVLLSAAVSVLQLAYLAKIFAWLLKKIRRYNQTRYSNTEDFPANFAWKAILALLTLMSAMWCVYLSDDRACKACVDVASTFIQVIMLIVILHPHWQLLDDASANVSGSMEPDLSPELETGCPVAAQPADKDTTADNGSRITTATEKTDQRMKDMEDKVIQLICDRKLYRNKNLKIDDVAEALGTNSTYLYNVFNRRGEGTFYQYINELRIEYCQQLLLENPQVKHEELVGRAGINSTSTFYRLFKNYTGQTPNGWLKDQLAKQTKEGK